MVKKENRKLLAIMFTDIVGYTAMMQKDEAGATDIRKKHRRIFQDLHEKHDGKILQYYGDGTLSIFESAVQSVDCAIRMQKHFQENEPKVPVRIGIHIGDVIYDDTEIYGDGVNVASRIEGMSTAGAILLSGRLNEELKNHTTISTRSLGTFEFKNISDSVEVFSVTGNGLIIPETAKLEGKFKNSIRSIAVLPFANISTGTEFEYLSDGMTEEIINALTRVKDLRVTSRTSSFYYKGKNIPITQIGKELNVSTILEGSIRLSGNKMRITAQLIDVKEDFHFWSETFDRSLDDIFAVQDEISLLIADKLREHLGHFEIKEHLVEEQNVSVSHYQKYLEARFHLLKMSRIEMEKGLSILLDLAKQAPDYPMAHLGLNHAYTMLGSIGVMSSAEAFEKGSVHLEKALELDDSIPECQLHLSWKAFLEEWDLQKAYDHLNRVLEARPMIDYYQTMASIVVVERKFKAAVNCIDTASQIDPFSDINFHLRGLIYYLQEDYENAIKYYQKSVDLKPDAEVSTLELGEAIILSGRKEEGLEYFQTLSDNKDPLIKIGGVCLAYASMNELDKMADGIGKLEAALETSQMERALYLLILCLVMAEKYDEALEKIEFGVAKRVPLLLYLSVDPLLKPLHSMHQFQVIKKKIFGEGITIESKAGRYKKSLLDHDSLKKYRNKLKEQMDLEKPYLNPNLTLRDLAEKVKIPANQLSQLLNEGFDKNFSEFVNSYRLEDFKSKLIDPGRKHLTLLAHALDSGFNSKTAFNTYFKKATGKTPKAYMKELNQ